MEASPVPTAAHVQPANPRSLMRDIGPMAMRLGNLEWNYLHAYWRQLKGAEWLVQNQKMPLTPGEAEQALDIYRAALLVARQRIDEALASLPARNFGSAPSETPPEQTFIPGNYARGSGV